MRKEQGITLIALVITIIVLLILAGVTMNLTLGEHGIFGTAMSAAEKSKIAEYKDKVELARVDVSSENMGIVTLDNLIDKIYEQKIVPIGSIEKINEEKAKMTTPEGYVFVITADKIEYVGKTDEIPSVPEVDLDKGNIEVRIDPETWTNENVKVTMINNEEGDYKLQYSINKGLTYTNYTEPITIEQITTIYIRLMNPLGETGTSATYKISNIDKIAPLNFIPTVDATTNSITINTSGALDGEATEKYGKSGIREIWYSSDDGTTWDTNEDKTNTTYTFNNLTQKTLYKTKVKVIDNAGNETITSTQEITTKEVTGATSSDEVQEGNITFTQTPTGWTNGNVEVSATTTETDLILQLSKSTEFPDNTNEVTSVEVSQNQTVYARLIDSTGQYNGTASTKVTTIDTENPIIGNVTSTTNSITFSATDNASGIVGIKVTESATEPTSFDSITSTTNLTNTTITGLTQKKTYYVWVKDQAGNISTSKSIGTGEVAISEGNITFTQTPTGWTNGNVTVTGATSSGYTLQLSTSTTFPSNTNELTSVEVSQNQTVYARLIDSTGQYNGTASTKVTTIDKEKPIIGTISSSPTSVTFTGTDNASGIKYYAVTTTNTEPTTGWTILTNSITNLSATTVSSLSQNTTYYVWLKDEAGNVSTCGTVKTGTQAVTSITLSPTSVTLQPGQTTTITATVNPTEAFNKTITWSSSNSGIATVNNGTVTAVGAGTTTIIATAQDGSNVQGSCTIEVSNPIKTLALIAEPGDYVEYDGGNGYTGLWQVLHNDDTYGLQIISSALVNESYTLSGLDGYNNAVNTLNTECRKYVNTSYATSGRCVGSNPLSPDDTAGTGNYWGYTMKKADTNYTIDYNAMKAATKRNTGGIHNLGKNYWLASRYVLSYTNNGFFHVRTVDSSGNTYNCSLLGASDSSLSPASRTCGLRTVITLKSGIQTSSGDGSASAPFKLVAQ